MSATNARTPGRRMAAVTEACRDADTSQPRREVSVGRENGLVTIDISGPAPERILFSQAEARKLLIEIENALNTGYGRDKDALRRKRT
ncbi:hypothetical protein QBC99_003568 [Beijerinckia sp. GAS462]|nr:hypothetical protein [Beijerinckia sp. GAS462]SEC88264.1 hypothetical protein SAMN05443249_3799 [Beijerinckia sp. 28-YEA-48]